MDMKNNNNVIKTVLVIRGGIGGLYSALKLIREEFNVIVIEK